MRDGSKLTCHLLDTGYCTAFEPFVIQGGQWRIIECHSLVALLRHPKHGWTLWDAGYSPRLWEATRAWPYRLYRWATPLHIRPELAVVNQLSHFGLEARDIRRVIISHFHADHIAGLADFPLAEIIALREAVEAVEGLEGWQALSRAFVPTLLPDDFARRLTLLERPQQLPSLGGLGPTLDLFGDGSACIVRLPGHARGQMGLLADTDRGPLCFVADACWLSESVRTGRLPNRVTNLIVDDAVQVKQTLQAIRSLAREKPDWQWIPTHCPEAFGRYVTAPARR
jgi:glyoxylase-like metal-dependent hydrolase (beta-lactamase superfamily II)